jgi:hypothetical protein
MFKSGKIYRHKNFKDVDMKVKECEDEGDRVRCIVDWISQTGTTQFAEDDEVYVSKSDNKNWKQISRNKH